MAVAVAAAAAEDVVLAVVVEMEKKKVSPHDGMNVGSVSLRPPMVMKIFFAMFLPSRMVTVLKKVRRCTMRNLMMIEKGNIVQRM